jgi:PDZ domain-containing secreted protein
MNSLLLSVENLETFNKTQEKSQKFFDNPAMFDSNFHQKQQMLENIKNILAIDEITITNSKEKTKEADEQLSTVSSMTNTNFTGIKYPSL